MTKARMRDTFVFDGEGVVIDSEKIWDLGQEEFLRRRQISYDRDKIKPLLAGRSMEEGVRILQAEYGFSGDPEELGRERIEIVRQLLKQDVEFVPGFWEFYGRIQATFKTCIATMMPKDLLDIVIDRLGLRALFGPHIYSWAPHAFRSKPEPDLFLHAARSLQSAPENCIVIEDSPNGVEAARRAHMFCIAITTTFEPRWLAQADVIVQSYDEIDLSRVTCQL